MRRVELHLSNVLLAFFLAVLVSFSAMMCLVDAFSLQCNLLHLLAVCGAASLASACAMLPKKIGVMSLGALAVFLGLLIWLRNPMLQSLLAVVHGITQEYASVYAAISVMGPDGDSLLALSAAAMWLSWITAWIVSREGNALFLVLACLPVLILCLMIVELAPVLWLVLLTVALFLLLMTHFVRERSVHEGSRLAWWLILPISILVTAITVLWPPADYERADWSDRLQTLAEETLRIETIQELPETVSQALPRWERARRNVDLSRLGPKAMTGRAVLECKDTRSAYYLRGESFAVYENNTWRPADREEYEAAQIPGQPLLTAAENEERGQLEIYTAGTQELLYTTYHLAGVPETAEWMDDAYVKNTGKLREYSIAYSLIGSVGTGIPYDNYVNKTYTQIPEDLKSELEQFLAQSGWDAAVTPEELAAFVRNSAEYDLNTPRIPFGEDFVLYFLQESHRGYCVHFATATVMLLRTMGIPARYVTGYSVKGIAGDWTIVTEDDAHAWVEYYVNGAGWIPLEPTPAVSGTQAVPDIQPDQQEPQPEQNETPVETELEPEQELPEQTQKPTAVNKSAKGISWNWLLVLPAALILICVRRWLTLRRRREQCRKGNPNRRAMVLWRWLIRLARQEGVSVEEELICIAEKARFSQHTLTEAELSQLQEALETRTQRLRQHSMGKQLWYQYGLLLY